MITCTCCNVPKSDYNFFRYLNRYDKTFFVNIPAKSDVCWECAGPYCCISCGVVQDASQFRVMGRVCKTCKGIGEIANPLELYTYKVGGNGGRKAEHPQNAENSVNGGVE